MNNLTLHDAYEIFLLDNQARRLTKAKQTFYREKVRVFIQWMAENDVIALDGVTSNLIKQYLIHLNAKGLKDSSQHDYARSIKTFLNFCVRDELLAKSPFAKVKLPQVEDRFPIVLTDTEIKTALQKVKAIRNRLIVRFILDSGVRASELLALNIADVDLVTGVVVVRHGKQQKDRLTAVGSVTRKELKKYLLGRKSPDSKAPLFITLTKGTRLTQIGLMHAFRKMRQETDIANLAAHTLRRTMATKSLENGMDAYILARMLGHANTEMLRRYIAISKKPIQHASEMYSVVDNLE